MTIQQTLANSKSFAELLPIARGVTVHLSFLGSRYVSVDGYSDTLELDALAAKVIELVEKYPQFDELERVYGKEIASLIDRNTYDAVDVLVNNSNCMTWLFVKARDLCHSIFLIFQKGITDACFAHGIRWHWKDNPFPSRYNHIFTFYTAEQFKNKFGITPEEAKKKDGYHLDFVFSSFRPDRYRLEKKV